MTPVVEVPLGYRAGAWRVGEHIASGSWGSVYAARGEDGAAYEQAGLRTLDTLFNAADVYLATDPAHEGLLLHSVYHWPNRWDHVPAGARTPRGESSQWGDYHAREAALYVRRLARGEPYLAFFGAGIARPASPPGLH